MEKDLHSFNRDENAQASQMSGIYLMLNEHTHHTRARIHLHTHPHAHTHACTSTHVCKNTDVGPQFLKSTVLDTLKPTVFVLYPETPEDLHIHYSDLH